jgi:hypothetical protein
MSLQELIVSAIVFFCVFYVGNRIVLFFRNSNNNENPCSSCTSGCELRDMMEKKKQQCREQKKGKKKSCCG